MGCLNAKSKLFLSLQAFRPSSILTFNTMQKEGLIPALESAHAFAQAYKEASGLGPDEIILVNQSGRGGKDIFTVADAFSDQQWHNFITQKAEAYGAELVS